MATAFEFTWRFWIIGAIFALGFHLYAVDRISLASWLALAVAPTTAAADVGSRAVLGLAALVVFTAAWLRTWGAAYLHTSVVHDRTQHSDVLVVDGPFRHVRHPLYLGNVILAAGLAFAASRLGAVVMVLGMVTFVRRLIAREDAALERRAGRAYATYAAAVPRLWPSWRPKVQATGATPAWPQAIVGETFVWLVGVAVLVYALTLRPRWAGAVLATSFVVYFTAVPLARRSRRT